MAPCYGAGVRDLSLFNVDLKRQNCPSARYVLAVNEIDFDTEIFNGLSVLVNDWKASDTFNS
jgi:hypothetical protein